MNKSVVAMNYFVIICLATETTCWSLWDVAKFLKRTMSVTRYTYTSHPRCIFYSCCTTIVSTRRKGCIPKETILILFHDPGWFWDSSSLKSILMQMAIIPQLYTRSSILYSNNGCKINGYIFNVICHFCCFSLLVKLNMHIFTYSINTCCNYLYDNTGPVSFPFFLLNQGNDCDDWLWNL